MSVNRDAELEQLSGMKVALQQARPGILSRPVAEIADVLGRVGERFSDPSDQLRRMALDKLPSEAKLSRELAEVVLDGMAAGWTREALSKLLENEFANPALLDGLVRAQQRGDARSLSVPRVMAVGPTLCVQISSGSVPGVGVNALIRSLLVKAPTLIKPGAGDVVLTQLFAEALRDADAELGSAVAVRYWSGGESHELTRQAVEGADAVVVYGSDESVLSVRGMLPVSCRFIAYHNRFGIGIVGREKLKDNIEDLADEVARAVAMFENRGCVCPEVLFVERGGHAKVEAFESLIAESLERLASEWSSHVEPVFTSRERSVLRQVRDTMEIHQAVGSVRMLHGGLENWTVVSELDLLQLPSLPGRSLRIRPVQNLEDVPSLLGESCRHIQSVGYAVDEDRVNDLAVLFGRVGASRVVPFDGMSFPPAWWLHDGQGPLRALIGWVEVQ
tara:strand:- start:697 stop:2037 length:1341 start_codon:yes stop_codon:yes gene_type:complete